MTLPERLRQLLDARGLSVAKLAKATGIPACATRSLARLSALTGE